MVKTQESTSPILWMKFHFLIDNFILLYALLSSMVILCGSLDYHTVLSSFFANYRKLWLVKRVVIILKTKPEQFKYFIKLVNHPTTSSYFP